MSNYDNDYSDETYDRYRITGEGAEYFEDEYEDETYEGYEVRDNRKVNRNNRNKDNNTHTSPSKIDIFVSIIIYAIIFITILTCLL